MDALRGKGKRKETPSHHEKDGWIESEGGWMDEGTLTVISRPSSWIIKAARAQARSEDISSRSCSVLLVVDITTGSLTFTWRAERTWRVYLPLQCSKENLFSSRKFPGSPPLQLEGGRIDWQCPQPHWAFRENAVAAAD